MKKNRMKFLIIEFLLLLLAEDFRSERSRAPDCGDSSGVR